MKKFLIPSLAAFILAVIPHVAQAQLWIYCGGLPSCGPGFTEHFSSTLTFLLTILPNYVYILGVLFIMIGGVYMAMSAGDSEKVTKGKNTIIWSIIGIFVMQFAETVVNFIIIPEASNVPAGDLVVSITGTLINDILILLYIILLVVAVISGMRMVLAFGKEEEFKKGKDGLFWAAVGAIIINLAQAIANVFCLTYPAVCTL